MNEIVVTGSSAMEWIGFNAAFLHIIYRLNCVTVSLRCWDELDVTVIQTQESKFAPTISTCYIFEWAGEKYMFIWNLNARTRDDVASA